jgi:hypothetical protein
MTAHDRTHVAGAKKVLDMSARRPQDRGDGRGGTSAWETSKERLRMPVQATEDKAIRALNRVTAFIRPSLRVRAPVWIAPRGFFVESPWLSGRAFSAVDFGVTIDCIC